MQKEENAQVRELNKLIKKVVRNSLKDNTLDHVVQISMSNLEPDQIKYSAQISSPAKGVEPITYSFNTFKELKEALIESEKAITREEVEVTFHENMINSLERRLEAHKARIEQIRNGEEDDIAMEEV